VPGARMASRLGPWVKSGDEDGLGMEMGGDGAGVAITLGTAAVDAEWGLMAGAGSGM
jgi:hypothetical protein